MPQGTSYSRRPQPKKRAAADSTRAADSALAAANIDAADLDPAMRETLTAEAARRVGAAGIQVRTRNPFDEMIASISAMFKGKKR